MVTVSTAVLPSITLGVRSLEEYCGTSSLMLVMEMVYVIVEPL